MTLSSLLALPDEILLGIFDKVDVLPRHRRRDLVSLTTVCRRLSSIATECLHSAVCVGLIGLVPLMEVYAVRPKLRNKVKSLELFWELQTEIETPPRLSQHAIDTYLAFALTCGLSNDVVEAFLTNLRHSTPTALFTTLMLFPNLHKLYLGTFTERASALTTDFQTWMDVKFDSPMSPRPYLSEAFALLTPRLTTLEVPIDLESDLDDEVDFVWRLNADLTRPFRWSLEHGMADWPDVMRRVTMGHPSLKQIFKWDFFQIIIDSMALGNMPCLRRYDFYMNARNPAWDNSLFYKEPSREEEMEMAGRLKGFVDELKGLGMEVVLHWCDYESIFLPMASLISGNLYTEKELRLVETRGGLEGLRAEAEVLGRCLKEKELKDEGGDDGSKLRM